MKIASIIQARTSSKRYPNKVFAKLGNKCVIEWVIHRAKKSKLTSDIILATTNEVCDKKLVRVAKNKKIVFFCGSKKNVLDRYIQSAKLNNVEIIVRICADRPFIDPKLIDNAVNFFINNNYDLVFNHISNKENFWPRGFGVEVFRTNLLESLEKKKLDERHKEHVTLYLWENRKNYRIQSVPFDIKNHCIFDMKVDFDTEEDYKNLKKISNEINMDTSIEEILFVCKKLRINGRE